ncbi:MAG: phosphopentomutase [Desulfuromonadales bacterium]
MSVRRRVVWIVLDGVGIGAAPDAPGYGDAAAATLPHVAAACGGLDLPNLGALGLGNLAEIKGVLPHKKPLGAYGRLTQLSAGKDSIIGHWELAGLVLNTPFATFPHGFPENLVREFTKIAKAQPLGNVPSDGVSILMEYGAEHLRTGRPILYTSVDSVMQVAAHEQVLSTDGLYKLCRAARPVADQFNVARVIARPFIGNEKDGYRRSPLRRDFPVPPPAETLLDCLTRHGYSVFAVGKIHDLFAGRGISRKIPTTNNIEGMARCLSALAELDQGLLMANLIDFDMLYGHRNDATGFGRALEEFDAWLPQLFGAMHQHDLLVISADHGCDPTTLGTDHSREYVPLLIWSQAMHQGVELGDRQSFADVAATLAEFFNVPWSASGLSLFDFLCQDGRPRL